MLHTAGKICHCKGKRQATKVTLVVKQSHLFQLPISRKVELLLGHSVLSANSIEDESSFLFVLDESYASSRASLFAKSFESFLDIDLDVKGATFINGIY
jgi:hypothetical protein